LSGTDGLKIDSIVASADAGGEGAGTV